MKFSPILYAVSYICIGYSQLAFMTVANKINTNSLKDYD